MSEVLVIIPTYNELSGLPKIVGRLRQVLPAADLLIVDDSSPDGTGELADQLASKDSAIVVLHRDAKQGLGRAYLAGFSLALDKGYQFIVEMDADGSHDPAELIQMLELAENGADLVLGSRWVPGGSVANWPWIRRFISKSGNRYARWVLNSRIRDLTSGFRIYRAQTLRRISLDSVSSQGYCFQIELAWRAERRGMTVIEHPIRFVERVDGKSKMHAGIVAEALLKVTWWGISRRRP